MIKHLLYVGLGGALGSVLRYLIMSYASKRFFGAFPLATLFINITGCILIGLFIGLTQRYQLINSNVRLFLVTGICGGYTTFSTFSYENLQLIQNKDFIILFYYIFFSLFIGIIGIRLGILISKI